MKRAAWPFGAAVGLGLAFGFGGPAVVGQQRYILSENEAWEAIGTFDPYSPEGQLTLARRALADGLMTKAQSLAADWIDRNQHHPLLPEAYLIKGDALMAQARYYDALFDYEHIARTFPASEAFVTALEREFEIARLYATGTKRKMFGMRLLDASDEAQELLILIQERLPGSALDERAAIELADFYYRSGKMGLAVGMYTLFLENHPRSRHVSRARWAISIAHLATFKGPEFDATGLHDARRSLEVLMNLEPATAERVGADALLIRVDEMDARKLLMTAQWYERTGDPIAAELILRRMLARYPRSVAATEALKLAHRLLPQLPASVRATAPDYRSLGGPMPGGPASTGESDDPSQGRDAPGGSEP